MRGLNIRSGPGTTYSIVGAVYGLDIVQVLGWMTVYGTLALTIIRGVPVIYDSISLFRSGA